MISDKIFGFFENKQTSVAPAPKPFKSRIVSFAVKSGKGIKTSFEGWSSGLFFGNYGGLDFTASTKTHQQIRECRRVAALSPIIKAYLGIVKNNITSPSPSLSLLSESDRDKESLDKIEKMWKRWRADKSVRSSNLTGDQFDQMLIASVLVGGDAVVIPLKSKGKFFMQYVQSEFIGRQGGNGLLPPSHGVSVDDRGGLKSILMRDSDGGEHEMDVNDLIFIRNDPVPIIERGLPAILPVLDLVRKVDELDQKYLDTLDLASKLQAIVIGSVKDTTQAGQSSKELEAGKLTVFEEFSSIAEGRPLFEQLSPSVPSKTAIEMKEQILMSIAATLGVAYESLSHNFSRANFASSRGSFMLERDNHERMIKWWADDYLKPLFSFWWEGYGKSQAIKEKININSGIENAVAYPTFVGRGWETVDPIKTANSLKTYYELGAISIQTMTEKAGFDYDQERERREREDAEASSNEGEDV